MSGAGGLVRAAGCRGRKEHEEGRGESREKREA